MSRSPIIEGVEAPHLKKTLPQFRVGDTVRARLRIIEGKKERLQAFTGIVIAKKGRGIAESFTVYRNAYGCNMQKVFFIHSPRLQSIEVISQGKVCRAKLNYLKGASGKAAKVKQRIVKASGSKKKKQVAKPEEKATESSKESLEENSSENKE